MSIFYVRSLSEIDFSRLNMKCFRRRPPSRAGTRFMKIPTVLYLARLPCRHHRSAPLTFIALPPSSDETATLMALVLIAPSAGPVSSRRRIKEASFASPHFVLNSSCHGFLLICYAVPTLSNCLGGKRTLLKVPFGLQDYTEN